MEDSTIDYDQIRNDMAYEQVPFLRIQNYNGDGETSSQLAPTKLDYVPASEDLSYTELKSKSEIQETPTKLESDAKQAPPSSVISEQSSSTSQNPGFKKGEWTRCAVRNCLKKKTPFNPMFRIPGPRHRDTAIAWLKKINYPIYQPNLFICCDHFAKEDYTEEIRDGKEIRRLKAGAIPSQNLNLPDKYPQMNRVEVANPSASSSVQEQSFGLITSRYIRQCCVLSCGKKSSSNVCLFKVPGPEKGKISNKWMAVLFKVIKYNKKLFICSDHFNDDDFCEAKGEGILKNRLKPNAVPSRNLVSKDDSNPKPAKHLKPPIQAKVRSLVEPSTSSSTYDPADYFPESSNSDFPLETQIEIKDEKYSPPVIPSKKRKIIRLVRVPQDSLGRPQFNRDFLRHTQFNQDSFKRPKFQNSKKPQLFPQITKKLQKPVEQMEAVKHICRICLKPTRKVLPIFNNDPISNAKLIEEALDIRLDPTDNLPKMICWGCLERVKGTCQLKKDWEDSKHVLEECQTVFKDTKVLECEEFTLKPPEDPISRKERKKKRKQENEMLSMVENNCLEDIFRFVKDSEPMDEECVSYLNSIKGFEKNSLDKPIPDFNKKSSNDRKVLFVCEICGKTDKSTNSFSHYRSAHMTPEERESFKVHKCPICGKGFYTYSLLAKHEFFHSKQKPWKCDKCDAAYTVSDALKRHKVDRHDEPTDIRCLKCNKGFIFLSERLRHEKKCDA